MGLPKLGAGDNHTTHPALGMAQSVFMQILSNSFEVLYHIIAKDNWYSYYILSNILLYYLSIQTMGFLGPFCGITVHSI
jgi:hypothetical protein